MTRRLVMLAILLIGCGDNANTTTTSTSSVTTTTSAATTTAVVSEFPLVVSSSGLLGYHDGTDWVPGASVFEVVGGEEYQVIDLGGVIGTAIGSTLEICEPIQTPMIELTPPLPVGHTEPGAIAITGASWEVVPGPVTIAGIPPPEMVTEAQGFLTNRGVDNPEPAVAQYLTFDLEGDGVSEQLAVFRRVPEDLIGNAGSYSMVLMRKLLDTEEATLVIEFSRGEEASPYVVSHTVTAIADLNGDARMEIVIDGHYYEGSGTTAWEYVNDDLGTVAALSAGCGA